VGWESTGREAVEEKERKMKRWRGIESICFRLKKRRNRAWVCCVFSQKPNKFFCLVSVKKTQQTRFM
jgi:hypothetical protein